MRNYCIVTVVDSIWYYFVYIFKFTLNDSASLHYGENHIVYLSTFDRDTRIVAQVSSSYDTGSREVGLTVLEINGEAKLALTLFKNALEASPSTELFWLSYINSLIENQDISNAFEVIEQSRQMG